MTDQDKGSAISELSLAGSGEIGDGESPRGLKIRSSQERTGSTPVPGISNQAVADIDETSEIPTVVKRSGRRKKGVSYFALHYRVRADRGTPSLCEQCGTTDPETFYDWANLTGKYDDVNDYIRLCRRCHVRKDGTWRNIPCLKNAELREAY